MKNKLRNYFVSPYLIYPFKTIVFLFLMSTTTSYSQEVKSEHSVANEIRYTGVAIKNVKIDVIGTVILIKGNETKVVIEADKESLKNIVSKHVGNTLSVHTKKGSSTSQTVLYLTLSDENIKMDINTVGKIIVADKLLIESLKMDVNSVGSIRLNSVGNDLTIKGKSIGSIELMGLVRKLNVDVLSIGSFKSSDMICNDLVFKIGAITSAEIYAKERLTLSVKACSIIKLKGDPILVQDKNNPLIKIEKI